MISIHALREEGDFGADGLTFSGVKFLSTPSARRATGRADHAADRAAISIHALREEGDRIRRLAEKQPDISIHALREEGDALC